MNFLRYKFVELAAPALLVLTLLCFSPLRAVEGPKGPDYDSVDTIKGIGNYKFGSKLDDYPKGSLLKVDPRAKSGLLRVSPYGDNYLVADVKGLTWGNIPLAGLVVTFHDGVLIDIQMALKAKNVDLYTAGRAFKEKYGPSDTESLPVESWEGDKVQVTMIFVGATPPSPNALSEMAQGKVELFDQARWNKIESVKKKQLNDVLNKAYNSDGSKAKANL